MRDYTNDECKIPDEEFDPYCCPDDLTEWSEDGRHSTIHCGPSCRNHRDYKEE